MLESLPVGIYWGSFDPITKAHEYIIRLALSHLSKLYLILNNDVRKAYQANALHRQQMLEIALEDIKDRIEFKTQHDEEEWSYFSLRRHLQTRLIAIVGSDSLAYWLTQKEESKLELYDEVWVVLRAEDDFLLTFEHPCIRFIEMPRSLRFVSSKMAKKAWQEKQEEQIEINLNPQVVTYIKKNRLYL